MFVGNFSKKNHGLYFVLDCSTCAPCGTCATWGTCATVRAKLKSAIRKVEIPSYLEGGGLEGCNRLRRTSTIRNLFHVVENSGDAEGAVSFTCVPGVAWGAAGNGGVPVMWGLGGGSGTTVCFQSPARIRAQPACSSRSGVPHKTLILVNFPVILVSISLGICLALLLVCWHFSLKKKRTLNCPRL